MDAKLKGKKQYFAQIFGVFDINFIKIYNAECDENVNRENRINKTENSVSS